MRRGIVQAWVDRHVGDDYFEPFGLVHAMEMGAEVTLCGDPVRIMTLTPWPPVDAVLRCPQCERRSAQA